MKKDKMYTMRIREELNGINNTIKLPVNQKDLHEIVVKWLSRFEMFGTFQEKLPYYPKEIKQLSYNFNKKYFSFGTRLGRDVMNFEIWQ